MVCVATCDRAQGGRVGLVPLRCSSQNLAPRGAIRRVQVRCVAPAEAVLQRKAFDATRAFRTFDEDGDGKLNLQQVEELIALAIQDGALADVGAPARSVPARSSAKVRGKGEVKGMWDERLAADVKLAQRRGLRRSAQRFLAGALAGPRTEAELGEMLLSAAGMFLAMLGIGAAAAWAVHLPVVGQLHVKGMPFILGSFGTLSVNIFGQPTNDAILPWRIVLAHLLANATAVLLVQAAGVSIVSRAAAMAVGLLAMLWTNCLHPPGGALIITIMDNSALQQLGWSLCLYPSLAGALLVLLPVGLLTNILKRRWKAHGTLWLQGLRQRSATGLSTVEAKAA